MAVTSTRVKVTYGTSQGFQFSVVFHVPPDIVDPNDTLVQAIVTAINALTAAFPLRIELSVVQGSLATPVADAPYVNEDKAEFTFVDENAMAHTYKLPGIKTVLVATDGKTVPIAGLTATFTAAVAANATGPGGEPLAEPVVGKRRTARKTLKK